MSVNKIDEKYLVAKKLISSANKSTNKKETLIQAFKIYVEIIEEEPNSVEAYLGLAVIAFSFENFSEALGFVDKVLTFEPEHIKAQKLRPIILKNIKSNSISQVAQESLKEKINPTSTVSKLTKDIFSSVNTKEKDITSELETIRNIKANSNKKRVTGPLKEPELPNIANSVSLFNNKKTSNSFFDLIANTKKKILK